MSPGARLRLPVSEADHSMGPEDAPLTLLEYGDFECPSCGAAHGVTKRLKQVLGDDLRLVFRHFPLTSAHPNAMNAALAAEAAAIQGRFWEMHDLLFENQDRLDPKSLIEYADRLKLNPRRFASDMAN